MDAKSESSTVFDGDHLATSGDRSMKRIRLRDAEVTLRADSAVDLRALSDAFAVNLTSGAVKVSAAQNRRFQLSAFGILIQTASESPISVEVTLISSTELKLVLEKGRLQLSMGEETRTVEPGHSYVVNLLTKEPSDSSKSRPQNAGNSHFIIKMIALISIGTGFAIWRSLVSPSTP